MYTEGGLTSKVGQKLMSRDEVTYVGRTIGEHSIDLRVEIFVKDHVTLLNILEEVKALQGVRDVTWSEVVETLGKKSSPSLKWI